MDSGFMSSPSESNVPSFFSSFYNQTYDFGLSKQEEGIDETLINDPHFNGSVSSSANGETNQTSLCIGCGNLIRDPFILRVAPNLEWHASCLKCADCGHLLDETCTCFLKNGKIYCKKDYTRLFGAKCNKCGLGLTKSDFVMRAKEKIYHTNCFKCVTCGRQLIPGDEFVLRENSVVCPEHHNVFTSNDVMGNTDCHNIPGFSSPTRTAPVVLSPTSMNGIRNHCSIGGSNHRSGNSTGSGQKRKDSKTTRVRTVLNEKQLHTLRSCYAANCRPDALMKEQLTEMTGLSARVIRVWFQNKRCKDKKRSLALKQMQEQQAKQQNSNEQNGSGNGSQGINGINGVPMIASEPVKNDPANPKPIEVQNFQQPAWKALSEFALQSEIEQPGFQHLMNNFSDHGQGSLSDSSEVCSIPSVSSAGIEVSTACSTPLAMAPTEPNSASACS